MTFLDGLAAVLLELLPVGVVLLLTLAAVWAVRRWAVRRSEAVPGGTSFRRDVLTIVIVAVASVPLLIALPVAEHTRGSLFTLLGIAVTAVISLGSSTFASNAMAGFMLRLIRQFREGDYVRIGDEFGRVTERGLLHTEIQTERSDLVTFPNLYMVTHPFRVIRPSGTFISTSLSLGYDVHNRTVEKLLLNAADSLGLGSPFVRILELGDFSVTYEVSGKLTDTKRFLGARSALDRAVLDSLHGAGIEIVSPTFMNQRPIPADRPVIPRAVEATAAAAGPPAEPDPDSKVFDKADQAQRASELKEDLARLVSEADEMENKLKTAEAAEKERLEKGIARRQELIARLGRRIEELTAKVKEE